MKNKSIVIYLFITLTFIFFGVNLTLSVMTGKNVLQVFGKETKETQEATLESIYQCDTTPKLLNLERSSDRRVRKLYEYQEVCNSLVTKEIMFFTGMPNSTESAQKMATGMVKTLQEFDRNELKPIVIVEPENSWGLVDFEEFKTGFYNSWIKDYFLALKNAGVSDEQMGKWVPFPEANIPSWNKNSSTPSDFGVIINQYASILKEVFPQTHVSILLNSATYDNADYDWAYGEYVSLKPFVENIKPGLIDSFGLQGFPWKPAKNSVSDSLVDPSRYLNYLLAQEAAEILKVKEVWFNTGTFSKKYVQDASKTVGLNYEERKNILDKTIEEVKKLQSRGYNVSINIFAENKSTATEQTDWSYWSNYQLKPISGEMLVFKNFVKKLKDNHIGLSLYDAYPTEAENKLF